jgi:predicted phosphoribosyltransferase
MHSVGEWYEDFSQTSDEEVRELLVQRPSASKSSSKRFENTAPLSE